MSFIDKVNKSKSIVSKSSSSKSKIDTYISKDVLPDGLQGLEAEIKTLGVRAANNFWLIGQRLNEIHIKQLFLSKGYASFEAYCKNEFEFSRTRAYGLISIYNSFDYGEYKDHGSKLILFSTFSKKERLELLKETKNKSYRETLNIVQDRRRALRKDPVPPVIASKTATFFIFKLRRALVTKEQVSQISSYIESVFLESNSTAKND